MFWCFSWYDGAFSIGTRRVFHEVFLPDEAPSQTDADGTIRGWKHRGDQLSVDHIIPRNICPQLDNVIANLEVMPMRMNSSKNDSVGARQVDYARKLNAAGLLTKKAVRAVESEAKKQRRR